MYRKNKFIIWGSSGHGKIISEIIIESRGKIISLFDNNKNAESIISGLQVYYGQSGFEDWMVGKKNLKNYFGAVAIGGSRGKERLAILKMFHENKICTPSIFDPKSVISKSSRIGTGSHVFALANISANVLVGEGCIINHLASIDHDCEIGKGCHIGPGSTLCGNITIKDNVFVGAGSVVLPGIKINKNVIVGAGSVVTKDIPSNCIVVGNPAKVIKII
jgi:sugar O-acyltransferase (sialic acid O-acetyltransferase NeuD family)